jgi:hypothetical protein
MPRFIINPQTPQSVRVLNFFDNGLGPGGATALAEALERGRFRDTLEGLYVRANQVRKVYIGRKGGKGKGKGTEFSVHGFASCAYSINRSTRSMTPPIEA